MKQAIPDDVISGAGRSALPTLFAGTLIVGVLYYGQELLVPLVLASLLAFVLAPVCDLLEKAWLPRVLAVLAAVLLAFAVFGGLGVVARRQVASLATSLPTYQSTVTTKWNAFLAARERTAKRAEPLASVPILAE